VLILKFREKFKVVGPACQRPTTAHGRVSRTACAHAPGDTAVARSPAATSHDVVTIKATVPRAPRPYPSTVRAGEALHGSTPMSCTLPFPITIIVPPPPPCPHLELPPHCSSVANVATDWSRSAAPQATGIVPRAPRSHPRAAIPMTSHQREVGVIHLVREGTTPSTPHLRPPPTTDDASSSFVVAPCCSTDLESAAPTTVQCHRH
jgi:hypothetical protein